MFSRIRGLLTAYSAEELAYQAKLRQFVTHMCSRTPTYLPDAPAIELVGRVVGGVVRAALDTRPELAASLEGDPSIYIALTRPLTRACLAVSEAAGERLTHATVRFAMIELCPAFERCPENHWYECLRYVSGSYKSLAKPLAEQIMVLRYIERKEPLVLQALVHQLSQEINKRRSFNVPVNGYGYDEDPGL